LTHSLIKEQPEEEQTLFLIDSAINKNLLVFGFGTRIFRVTSTIFTSKDLEEKA